MTMRFRILVAGLLACFINGAQAYEIDTHAALSKSAAEKSVLANADLLRALGLAHPITSEEQKFPNSKNQSQTILDIIQDGARFEDGLKTDCETRPQHHFYDPVRDRGLRWLTVSGEKSPDWALEDVNDNDKQDYSYKDARYYLYRALTATTEEDRNKYFGLTFQSLGQVIHHPQDMAQPQHVRNDTHIIAGEDCAWYQKPFIKLVENPSLYEQYTKTLGNLPIGLYPKVRFDTARRYWHTEDKNPGAGQGIAEFTNSNFVSAGTNFRGAFQNGQLTALPNERYALPVPSVNTPSYADGNALLTLASKSIPAECLPPNPPLLDGICIERGQG